MGGGNLWGHSKVVEVKNICVVEKGEGSRKGSIIITEMGIIYIEGRGGGENGG